MNLGTAGAFLVLESLERAQARGAHIYARLDAVLGDRGSREGERMEQRLARLADETGASDGSDTVVFSGASGYPDLSARERAFLKSRFPSAPVRTVGALFGHSIEAHFPTAVALACLALDDDAPISPFAAGEDAPPSAAANSAIVTSVGHFRGEGIALTDEDVMSKAAYKDHLGRPLVAVTGMGVVSSLGQGSKTTGQR
jgi:3-oxoacyl-[acyl-carrier-protein] synthase II